MTSNTRNRTRVILHVDLDAFYCKTNLAVSAWHFTLRSVSHTPVVTGQVEMKRVGIPPHVPCAVQQWEGLIAGQLHTSYLGHAVSSA